MCPSADVDRQLVVPVCYLPQCSLRVAAGNRYKTVVSLSFSVCHSVCKVPLKGVPTPFVSFPNSRAGTCGKPFKFAGDPRHYNAAHVHKHAHVPQTAPRLPLGLICSALTITLVIPLSSPRFHSFSELVSSAHARLNQRCCLQSSSDVLK